MQKLMSIRQGAHHTHEPLLTLPCRDFQALLCSLLDAWHHAFFYTKRFIERMITLCAAKPAQALWRSPFLRSLQTNCVGSVADAWPWALMSRCSWQGSLLAQSFLAWVLLHRHLVMLRSCDHCPCRPAVSTVLCNLDLAIAVARSPFEVVTTDTGALWCLQASKRLIRPHGSTVPAEVATTAAPSVTPQRSLPLPKRTLPAPGVQPPAPAVAAQLALDLLSPHAGGPASSSVLSPRQAFGLLRGGGAEAPAGILSPRQVSGGRSSSTALPAGIPSPQQGPVQRRRTKAELQTGTSRPQGHGRDGRSGSAVLQVSPSTAHSRPDCLHCNREALLQTLRPCAWPVKTEFGLLQV